MKTFDQSKNVRELNLDTTKKFILLQEGNAYFDVGDILELINDDGSSLPLFKRLSDGKEGVCSLDRLAYAPEQEKEDQKKEGKQKYISIDQAMTEIITWLYLNSDHFSCKKEKREEFISKLRETFRNVR